jgi:hypothetical protein
MNRMQTTKFAKRNRALGRAGLAVAAFAALSAWTGTHAQDAPPQMQTAPTGAIVFSASVTPTDGRPEPVRAFTFYLLRRSLADLHAEVQAADPPPQLDVFIDALTVTPEMKAWMKKNQSVDLAGTDFTHKLTPDAILGVPEFLKAYITYNAGYPGSGFPVPKYRESDAQKDPDKYARELKEYHAAILRFAIANPTSKEGMEAELTDLNQNQKWTALVAGELDRVRKGTLRLAQMQYLAAQTDTDLNGQGSIAGVAPGDYWLGTLGSVAQAGDIRQSWDVPVKVRAGQTTSIALTNLNANATIFPKP